ncbi:MAG: C40 family peptidase [Actinomycetota bacterium]|nr:C40 family peptidase [Actinomycetota bacterium]
MRRLACAVAVLVGLAAPAVAHAAGPAAEVRTPGGRLLAAGKGSSFSYGSLVQVAKITRTARRTTLDGVSLLDGRIHIARLVVGVRGNGRIEDLVIDGLLRRTRQNGIYSLDSSTYAVALQKAVVGGYSGFVGLRLNVAPGYPGFARGVQVLVGLPATAATPRRKAALASNGPLEQVKRSGPWTTLGFSSAPDLSNLKSTPEPFVSLSLGGASPVGWQAVELAKQFLGIPYVWGGGHPDVGFDCSGLTQYVYARLGISLTHFTGNQIHEGMPVPSSSLQPGDLVFFDPEPYGPGHEGMYIGDGRFIHAPHTGDVVKISSLASYMDRYVGAVRPYAQ